MNNMHSRKRTFGFLIVTSILFGGGIGIAYANNNESKLPTASSIAAKAEMSDNIVTDKLTVSETVKLETAETVPTEESAAVTTSEISAEVLPAEISGITSAAATETTAAVNPEIGVESGAEISVSATETIKSVEPEAEPSPVAVHDTNLPANIAEEDVVAVERETAESITEVGTQIENRRIIAERVGIDISELDRFTDAEIADARAAAESIGGDPGYSYNYLLNGNQHLPGVPVK